MDMELLKTFLEVKNTRHFGRAAENLYVTQAAVSARIKQLESTLGTALFTRYRNNLQLTPSGNRLIEHAEIMLLSWERAKTDVSLKTNQSQIIALGTTSGLWDLLLKDGLNDVHKELPNIVLRAESHGQDILVRRLMERTLDLVFIYEPAKITELISQNIAESELLLVSTIKDQELNVAININHVSVDWGTAFINNYSQYYKEVNPPVLYTTLARIALDFILFHGGSAYLPLRMIKKYLDISLFRVEAAPLFKRTIYACYHKENRNTDLINQILSIVELTGKNYLLP